MQYFIIRFCFYRTCSYLICEPSHNSINATYLIRGTSLTCHCLWKYLFPRMLFDPFKVLFLTLWDELWGRLFSTKAEEGLQTSDFRLQTSDFRLQTSDFRFQIFVCNLSYFQIVVAWWNFKFVPKLKNIIQSFNNKLKTFLWLLN